MGVHGLWDLLSPVGRRVSVETLAGKRLAIDASIWMVQFMKAMRDERGEMVRNAHILGFFRRICKLLYLRTKPVFVFDGATPALKRRTVIARRRHRENAQAKIRKTAEKLLLNHLKAMRLKELANDLENQRKSNVGKGKKVVVERDNDDKGKKVITEKDDVAGTFGKSDSLDTKDYDQEALDAMLAASIEAEESGVFMDGASTSGGAALVEEEEGDEDDDDEEMLLPTLQGNVDPAVLASLPPSMQLDLLGQMRERLMAENRQKYQKVKKAPAKFSELQIDAYLKTVAFRREINEVQKAAGGRGVAGVQTSRIASEANREYIFSSSFTGNRQSVTSAGVDANSTAQSQVAARTPSIGSVNGVASTSALSSAFESFLSERKKGFHQDIETYRDEMGRVRMNKRKAMGIHMTRDLQRNLDLMKENEQNQIDTGSKLPENSKETNQVSVPVSGTVIEVSFEDDNEQQFVDSYDDVFARMVGDSLVASSADNTSSVKQTTITLSDSEGEEGLPGDVEGEKPAAGHTASDESEVEWEEGPSENPELGPVREDEHTETALRGDESEVEWEEGPSGSPELGSVPEVELVEPVSKGDLLEELDFQEAIRLSMEEMRSTKDIDASFDFEEFKDDKNMDTECAESVLPNITSTYADEINIGMANSSLTPQLDETALNDSDKMEVQTVTSYQSGQKDDNELSMKAGETGHVDMVNPTKESEVDLSNELHEGNCRGDAETLEPKVHVSTSPDVVIADAHQHELKSLVTDHVPETLEPRGIAVEESKSDFDFVHNIIEERDKGIAVEESKSDFDAVQNITEERDTNTPYEQREDGAKKSVMPDMSEEQVSFTKASLEEEVRTLDKERNDLGDEQRRLERNAESVSGEMFTECQELLQMFGLPYIIAPMEAEAQCAYMELENLVDGVVTDDSDVLLFGARSVYKNIFDDRKYVETYFMKDIESELGLTREKLIRMAMLLGSDYTEGISGIGIVNAVEVLNAFPEEDGLQKFREWIESPDPSILGKVNAKEGSSTRKKGSNISAEEAFTADDDINRMKQIFMDKHRNVSKNWHIPATFPSDVVISAYASPQVDKSTEPFSWGKPDLFVLRKLCFEKFGWGSQKADELLQPVLKEYNKHETQLRLEAFYTFNERFAKIRSKRISKAVKGIAGSKSSELIDHDDLHPANGKKRKKVEHEKGKDDVEKEQLSEDSEFLISEGRGKKTKKGSSVRGRGRGRGRGQSAGRGMRKKNNLELSGTSSDDENNSDYVQEVDDEHTKGQRGVRKSKRVKKSVITTNNEDSEMDEPRIQGHAEVAGNEEPSNQEETLVSTASIGVGGSNDHKSPVSSGIHPDDAEVDKDWSQNKEDGPEAELSKEYLKMGGGFCADEEEGDKEPGISGCSPLTEELTEASHLGEAEASISPKAGSTDLMATTSQENNKVNDVIRPVTFLSAMPNLRKKRKKV